LVTVKQSLAPVRRFGGDAMSSPLFTYCVIMIVAPSVPPAVPPIGPARQAPTTTSPPTTITAPTVWHVGPHVIVPQLDANMHQSR